ncbi:unnamed protein product [Candida verbasci]|uniref:Kynureninase n=1 Tax=Candida verbasci TaxID=1227364 RepID=A0A9W4X9P5_9ASCO|nr:unnamed protein product [Candida verbasci]
MQESNLLDEKYKTYKYEFNIPTFGSLNINSENYDANTDAIYLCGNSLGLMPKNTKSAINNELNAWAERAVESHFNHPTKTNWVDIDLPLIPLLCPLIGAKENEIAIMGSLTNNLNNLLIHFYKPKNKRTKILFEKQAFPSDYYAFVNIVKLFGYDETHLIQVEIPQGQTYLEFEDIQKVFDKYQDEIALVCFPGIQYYTGQFFQIEKITNYIKSKNNEIIVGWDLAHAVGNVPLKLHDWNVDFATWCSYKYLNSGPGAISGIYVSEKFTKDNSKNNYKPRLAGWWGNNPNDRFKMLESFDPINSALSYRQSNPSVIDVVSLQASLEIFNKIGIDKLREKSIELTNYLESLLKESKHYYKKFKILTPENPEERGCQLSIYFDEMEKVNEYLRDHAIICDERRPNVIRFAPVPLYNTFTEVYYTVLRINEILDKI